MRRFLFGTAALFAALAIAGFIWVWRTPWAPQTAFDIIGILWLLENLPKLFVFVLSVLLSGLSAYLFLKAHALVGLADGRSLEDEGRRILQDPRFHGIVRPPAQPQGSSPTPSEPTPAEPER